MSSTSHNLLIDPANPGPLAQNLTGAAFAHVSASNAAGISGFTGLAAAHAKLARRELCVCGQMFADYCPGDGRCPLGE